MIDVRAMTVDQKGGVRVEILPSLLPAYGRKLYTVSQGSIMHIPSGRAHAHQSQDILMPIAGNVRLAYMRSSGQIQYLQMRQGAVYVVGSCVPHQIEIEAGVLESIFPTVIYQHGTTMWELAGGFF